MDQCSEDNLTSLDSAATRNCELGKFKHAAIALTKGVDFGLVKLVGGQTFVRVKPESHRANGFISVECEERKCRPSRYDRVRRIATFRIHSTNDVARNREIVARSRESNMK